MKLTFNQTLSWPNKNRGYSLARQEAVTGWLFVLPIVIGFSIFTFWAVIYSFIISLTSWNLLSDAKFAGFANYIKIFSDEDFWECMYNTLFFVVSLVPLVLVVSMTLAIMLNSKGLRFAQFFRVSLYMPSITSTIAIGIIWIWIFNPDNGLVNLLLTSLGLTHPPRWLESTFWAKPALVIVRVWQMSGYHMLLFLAGLQSIPETLYEAAEVDGATGWKKIRHITIPLLSNTTFFVTIMLIIESFNIFESVWVMTKGGPAGSTNTLLYYIYTSAFQTYKMGYAAALAYILFAIIFTLTLVQFSIRKKREE